MWTPRRVVALAVAIGLALVLLLWRFGKKPETAQAPPPAAQPAETPRASTRAPTAIQPSDMAPPTVAEVQRQLDLYKKAAVYPHWSLPLRRDMQFMLAWNKAVAEDTLFGDHPDAGIFFRFDADRAHVLYGEPYTAYLEVFKLDANKNHIRLPVQIDSAVVQKTEGPDQGDAMQLSFVDDGNHRYSARIVPSQEPALQGASTARIVVVAAAAGQKRQVIRDFTYAPRRVLDVLGVTDSVKDGSLVATLSVKVYEDGVYTFYGNLMEADGETPIASSKLSYPLKAGPARADLIFFGKVLRDFGASGPYVVRDIHGLKRGSENGLVFEDSRQFTTKPYKVTDFSDAEWDSEEKRERIKRFEGLISSMSAGGGGAGAHPIGK